MPVALELLLSLQENPWKNARKREIISFDIFHMKLLEATFILLETTPQPHPICKRFGTEVRALFQVLLCLR